MNRTLTDGFDQYFRPDLERRKAALEEGMVVLDTNVLLNILRYSPAARTELLKVLEAVAARCFIPYQVAVEYNRHRVGVVVDRHKEFATTAEDIQRVREDVRAIVRALSNRRMLPEEKVEALEQLERTFVQALVDAQQDATANYDLTPEVMSGRKDPWTTRLDEILEGRVADKPKQEDLDRDIAEGQRRKEARLAPGFVDKEPGDYMWWAEVLRSPQLKDQALLIISDDAAKHDWRYKDRGGFIVGPHEILTDDVREAGGRDLVLLTTHELLQLVDELEPDKVSEATLAESERIQSDEGLFWGFEAYHQLILRLEENGYTDRAEVVKAAASHGGFISRQDVYAITGMDMDTRSLRHFSTPAETVRRQLVASGLLPSEAPRAMTAQYDGPGKTEGYAVPPEFPAYWDLRDSPLD